MTETEMRLRTPAQVAAPAPESSDEGHCRTCGVELGWRDAAYVPAGEREHTCKRCYQREERKAARGEFVPFSMPMLRGGRLVQVARPGNRTMRRAAKRLEQKRATAKRLAGRAGQAVA